jgi:hypothetical protein
MISHVASSESCCDTVLYLNKLLSNKTNQTNQETRTTKGGVPKIPKLAHLSVLSLQKGRNAFAEHQTANKTVVTLGTRPSTNQEKRGFQRKKKTANQPILLQPELVLLSSIVVVAASSRVHLLQTLHLRHRRNGFARRTRTQHIVDRLLPGRVFLRRFVCWIHHILASLKQQKQILFLKKRHNTRRCKTNRSFHDKGKRRLFAILLLSDFHSRLQTN